MKKTTIKFLLVLLLTTLAAHNSFGQKTAGAAAQKKQLVNRLVEQTFQAYPLKVLIDAIEEKKAQLTGELKNGLTASIIANIDARESFSAEKKAAAKNNIPEFTDQLVKRLNVVVNSDLNAEQWLKDALRQNYASGLTVLDLKITVAFLDTSEGKSFLASIQPDAPEPDSDPEKSPVFQKFANSPTADKFLASFLNKSGAILMGRVTKWGDTAIINLDRDVKSGELHRLLNDFAEKNLK